MDGPLWSFLLDLAPIRRAVQREVNRAVNETWQTAQDMLDKERERHQNALDTAQDMLDKEREGHQKALDDSKQRTSDAEQRTSEDEQRIRQLQQYAAHLRDELSAQDEADKRRQRDREADAERDRNTKSDLFCCQHCASLWLLSMRPDHSYTVHGPIGQGCTDCKVDQPLLRLAAVKASIVETDEVDQVARPSDDLPYLAVDVPVQGDRAARTDVGVKFVAEWLQNGPDAAIAQTLAHQASTFVRDEANPIAPATDCAGLSAIADGLDRIPTAISNGIAWLATEIIGVPEFLARVLGVVITHVALHAMPLHTIAQGIRAVGAVSCAADGHLEQCQCARHLEADVVEFGGIKLCDHDLARIEPDPGVSEAPQTVVPGASAQPGQQPKFKLGGI